MLSISLDGKVVLVTGGSRGIGAATVRLFTAAGARVVFNYRQARAAAETLGAACPGAVALEQELSSVEDGRMLVARAVAVHGRLDALVVNHGVWPPHDAPIDRMADVQWRGTMGVNLDSVFGLVQAAAAQMKLQRRTQREGDGDGASSAGGSAPGTPAPAGHIVLVSSTAGQRGEAFHADYAASKGAIISLTKSLATELARDGIAVNCVAPGWVATDMAAPALADLTVRERIFAAIPLGRVGLPDEIAGPILFLCTPWAGFMTGEIVNVNGGAVLVG